MLKNHSAEELKRCIQRYSNEVKDKEKQFILHGSTFFNGRYEDYLDENYNKISSQVEETKGQIIDFKMMIGEKL